MCNAENTLKSYRSAQNRAKANNDTFCIINKRTATYNYVYQWVCMQRLTPRRLKYVHFCQGIPPNESKILWELSTINISIILDGNDSILTFSLYFFSYYRTLGFKQDQPQTYSLTLMIRTSISNPSWNDTPLTSLLCLTLDLSLLHTLTTKLASFPFPSYQNT